MKNILSMNRLVKTFTLFLCLLFVACNGNKSATEQQSDNLPQRTFETVPVPVMISEPEERFEYAAKHYWDKFDFTDTVYIHLPDVTEQAFVNYIGFLGYLPIEKGTANIKDMMKKAETDKKVYVYFMDLYEKYLYDPNSPARDEELYIAVLESLLSSSVLDEVQKVRPAHLLEIALKNRIGEKAIDFAYTLSNNTVDRLYNVKADYLILFFNNPDCETCHAVIQEMSASLLIQNFIKNGKLKILAVYPDDDEPAWRSHMSFIPSDWINGFDKTQTLKNEELYDLKAIPTIYLLDKDKQVLLKDVEYRQLADYLATLLNN